MATPDLPEAAVGAAAGALWVTSVVDGSPSVGVNVRAALAAAAPHIRADERARVLDEVQAALRDDRLAEAVALATGEHHLDTDGGDDCVCGHWGDGKDGPGWDDHMAEVSTRTIADYLRDTVGPAESDSEPLASGDTDEPRTGRSDDLSGPQ